MIIIVEFINVAMYCFDSFTYFHSNITSNTNNVGIKSKLHILWASDSDVTLSTKKIKSIIVLPQRLIRFPGVSESCFLFIPRNLSTISPTKTTTKIERTIIIKKLTINPLQLSLSHSSKAITL